jgi:putative DNA primase/helicase
VVWPAGYTLNSKGLWFAKDSESAPIQLSGPFTVIGLARDPNGRGWAIGLTWHDQDGSLHQAFVARGDLIGDGMDALRPLVSCGLSLSPNSARLKLFKAALADLACGSRVRLVKRAGWHGPVFVLPSGTIGRLANENVVFDGRAEAARYEQAGSLQEWIGAVAMPAAGNSRLVLALSVACAGPLNDLLQGEGGGIHLVGGSSLGKSTALVAAGSVWGGGGRAGFT